MNLANIQGRLSRNEMKSVNAGTNEAGCGVNNCAEVGAPCGTNPALNCRCNNKDKRGNTVELYCAEYFFLGVD